MDGLHYTSLRFMVIGNSDILKDNNSINENELDWILGRLDVVKYLVVKGADIDAKANNGHTALLDSCLFGNSKY